MPRLCPKSLDRVQSEDDEATMPIRRGSVNLARFRMEGAVPKDVKRWLQKGLGKAGFEPIDPKSDDERAAGFVELEQNDSTEFSAGALFHGLHALFAWRVDRLKVPTNALRAGLLEWGQAFEKKNKRPAGRRERTEQKDALKKTLRAKQAPVTKVFELSVDPVMETPTALRLCSPPPSCPALLPVFLWACMKPAALSPVSTQKFELGTSLLHVAGGSDKFSTIDGFLPGVAPGLAQVTGFTHHKYFWLRLQCGEKSYTRKLPFTLRIGSTGPGPHGPTRKNWFW